MRLEELKLFLLVLTPMVGLLQAPYLEEGEHERSLRMLKEPPGEAKELLLLRLRKSLEWLVIAATRRPDEAVGTTEKEKKHTPGSRADFNSCLC